MHYVQELEGNYDSGRVVWTEGPFATYEAAKMLADEVNRLREGGTTHAVVTMVWGADEELAEGYGH